MAESARWGGGLDNVAVEWVPLRWPEQRDSFLSLAAQENGCVHPSATVPHSESRWLPHDFRDLVRRSLGVFQLAQQVQEGSPEGLLVASLQPNRSDCGEFVGDSNLPQLGSRRAYYVTTVIFALAVLGAGRLN